MPCMGPDLDYARKHGREVGETILAKLIADNDLWDITAEKDNTVFILPHAKTRWSKAKEEFLKSVEELFVEDGCNGF